MWGIVSQLFAWVFSCRDVEASPKVQAWESSRRRKARVWEISRIYPLQPYSHGILRFRRIFYRIQSSRFEQCLSSEKLVKGFDLTCHSPIFWYLIRLKDKTWKKSILHASLCNVDPCSGCLDFQTLQTHFTNNQKGGPHCKDKINEVPPMILSPKISVGSKRSTTTRVNTPWGSMENQVFACSVPWP